MANCPRCGRSYDDGLTFCLDDGSLLTVESAAGSTIRTTPVQSRSPYDHNGPETLIRRTAPTSSRGPGAMTVIVLLLIVVAGFAALGGLAVAGFVYFASSGTSEYGPTPTPISSPIPNDTTGDAVPVGPIDDLPANKVKRDQRIVDIRKDIPSSIDNSTSPSRPITEIEPRTDRPVAKQVPKQISGGVINGKAVSLPKPPYPAAARAVRASGSVTVQVLVDENGHVVSASAVSGHPLLRAAAASAARQAKFSPTLLAGKPVRVSGILTYNFAPPAS